MITSPHLYQHIHLPSAFQTTSQWQNQAIRYGGDISWNEYSRCSGYIPWSPDVYLYTPEPLDESAYRGYSATSRQYNARLMD